MEELLVYELDRDKGDEFVNELKNERLVFYPRVNTKEKKYLMEQPDSFSADLSLSLEQDSERPKKEEKRIPTPSSCNPESVKQKSYIDQKYDFE